MKKAPLVIAAIAALSLHTASAKADGPPAAAQSVADWQRIGGFTSLGVGTAAFAVSFVSMLQIQSMNADPTLHAYRLTVYQRAGAVDACKVAETDASAAAVDVRSICSKGKTFETLQIVMLPIGALATAAGALLLSTDRRPWTSKVPEVRAAVGKSSTKVDVTFRF